MYSDDIVECLLLLESTRRSMAVRINAWERESPSKFEQVLAVVRNYEKDLTKVQEILKNVKIVEAVEPVNEYRKVTINT